MGIKDTLSKIFGGQAGVPEWDKLLDELNTEVLHTYRYIYGDIKLKEFSSYEKVESLPEEQKAEFLVYLAGKALQLSNKSRKSPASNADSPVWKHSIIAFCLLKSLLRKKLLLKASDLSQIIHTIIKDKDDFLNNWPVGYIINQIEYYNEQNQASPFPVQEVGKLYAWYKKKNPANSKAQYNQTLLKLDNLQKGNSASSAGAEPYLLSQEDELGDKLNTYVSKCKRDEQDAWYSLFHKAATASGSKPTAAYLKETKGYIDTIGSDRFKAATAQWMELLAGKQVYNATLTYYSGNDEIQYTKPRLVAEKNQPVIKGLIWAMLNAHDKQALQLLSQLAERCYKKIPGVGSPEVALGNACLYVLAHAKGLEGIGHLSQLKQRVKQNSVRSTIEKYLAQAAKKRGLEPEEMEDMTVPAYGFDSTGSRQVAFDEYTLEIKLNGLATPTQQWIKPGGSTQKTPPAIIKGDEKLEKKLKQVKNDVKQAQKTITALRDRLDRSLKTTREIKWPFFEEHYLQHPLASQLAHKLIWILKYSDKEIQAICPDGKWQDVNGKPIDASHEAPVAAVLWHPVHSIAAEIKNWRSRLEELELQQPLKQAYREIYLLTQAELRTGNYSNRMAAHILKQHQFHALAGVRGWKNLLMGAFDNGGGIASLELPQAGLCAELWLNEVASDEEVSDSGIWLYVATDQVRFVNAEGDPVPLERVPAVVFSEVMRDVDLFAGVSSVGNDPQWQDSGGLPQYRDYWQSFSFGDLSEIAKSRKELLDKLLPRLKIRNIARIEGNFLKVQGKLRIYKIHIGSTNILMEPDDQYLCIVPARGGTVVKQEVFLPFEGDTGLSVLLSKAFLLSEDDKITDSSITSQITG